jgi:hypothetical protein
VPHSLVKQRTRLPSGNVNVQMGDRSMLLLTLCPGDTLFFRLTVNSHMLTLIVPLLDPSFVMIVDNRNEVEPVVSFSRMHLFSVG